MKLWRERMDLQEGTGEEGSGEKGGGRRRRRKKRRKRGLPCLRSSLEDDHERHEKLETLS
jgi:hypothetical protein